MRISINFNKYCNAHINTHMKIMFIIYCFSIAGEDYLPIVDLELIFEADEVSRDVNIVILNDTAIEDDEIFSCVIQPRQGDTSVDISLRRAQVIIQSDDQGQRGCTMITSTSISNYMMIFCIKLKERKVLHLQFKLNFIERL